VPSLVQLEKLVEPRAALSGAVEKQKQQEQKHEHEQKQNQEMG
jgi:hypothetical protein